MSTLIKKAAPRDSNIPPGDIIGEIAIYGSALTPQRFWRYELILTNKQASEVLSLRIPHRRLTKTERERKQEKGLLGDLADQYYQKHRRF